MGLGLLLYISNQTINHQWRSGSIPTHACLNFFLLKNGRDLDFHVHFSSRNFKRYRNFM